MIADSGRDRLVRTATEVIDVPAQTVYVVNTVGAPRSVTQEASCRIITTDPITTTRTGTSR